MIRTTISVILLLLAGGIFLIYTKPAYDQAMTMQAQVASYDEALGKAQELAKRRDVLLARARSFSTEDMDRLQKLLPDHVDNIRLIMDFDNLARQYGMSLENVDISSPASSAQTSGSIASTPIGNAKYDTITIKFSTRGTYATFQKFLQGLQSNLRIVDLVTLNFSPDSGNQVATGEPVYHYDIVLRTYWLK